MHCEFSQDWRRAFLQRHGHSLPPVIKTLFSLSPERDDLILDGSSTKPIHAQERELSGALSSVGEEEDVVNDRPEESVEAKEAVSEQAEHPVEWDDDMCKAIQQAFAAYIKVGFSEIKARRMLGRMGVPGADEDVFLFSEKYSDEINGLILSAF